MRLNCFHCFSSLLALTLLVCAVSVWPYRVLHAQTVEPGAGASPHPDISAQNSETGGAASPTFEDKPASESAAGNDKDIAEEPKEKKPFKALYEAVKEDPVRWLPEAWIKDEEEKSLSARIITPPAKKKYVDPFFEPVFMLRTLYVTTREDSFTDESGKVRQSKELRRTYFGHREGFVLENVEVGFKGRINDVGLYYGAKLELVPREKDGTKSESDILKEALFGWNYYSVFDVKVGRIKIPFSQTNLKSTHDMTLVYAPILDSLLPKRLIGVSSMVADPWDIARLYGGAFNTIKEPHEQMPSGDNLMYVGRMELMVDHIFDTANLKTGEFFNLKFGGGLAYSKQNFDPLTELRLINVDGRLDLYIFSFEGEYLLRDYYGEGTESNNALRGKGWHFDFVLHAWPTVIDLTYRIEEADNNEELVIDFPTDAGMAVNQKKRWMTVGLMLHVLRQVDLAVNYVMRGEAEGRDLSNDMLVTMVQINL